MSMMRGASTATGAPPRKRQPMTASGSRRRVEHIQPHKGGFSTVHVTNQPHGEVEPYFIRDFFHELGLIWHLIDQEGNRHDVTFNKSIEAPHITDGWQDLRVSYGLTGNHNIFFGYLGESNFKITVYNRHCSREEFPTFHSLSTKHRPVSFTITLTKVKATASHLDLHKGIAEHVRNSGFGSLLLCGPGGGHTSCQLLVPSEPRSSTKIGMGWKKFCKDNELKAGMKIKFKFRDIETNNIVDVFIT